MAQFVCLDTNVLSWFLRTNRDKDEDKMERAQTLIETLHREQATVALPSIVLAEALCIVPNNGFQAVLDSVKTNFPIFQFDELAAYYYRSIFQKTRDIMVDAPRWSKSADVKIVSTALAHGATRIYSEDSGLAKIAEGLISVAGLPSLPQRRKPLPMTIPNQ